MNTVNLGARSVFATLRATRILLKTTLFSSEEDITLPYAGSPVKRTRNNDLPHAVRSSDLPPRLKKFAQTLAAWAFPDGTYQHPFSVRRLTEDAGIGLSSRRIVRARLSELEAVGVLQVLSPANGRGNIRRYRFVEAELRQAAEKLTAYRAAEGVTKGSLSTTEKGVTKGSLFAEKGVTKGSLSSGVLQYKELTVQKTTGADAPIAPVRSLPANTRQLPTTNGSARRPTAAREFSPRPATAVAPLKLDSPKYDPTRTADRTAAQNAQQAANAQRDAEIATAIATMRPAGRDALRSAAALDLADSKHLISADRFEATLRLHMTNLVRQAARGHTVAEAVAYYDPTPAASTLQESPNWHAAGEYPPETRGFQPWTAQHASSAA